MGAIPGIDPPPCFSKVLILEGDKVVCFHTVLKVLILRGVGGAPWRRKDEYVIGVRQLAGRADRDSSQLSVDSLQSETSPCAGCNVRQRRVPGRKIWQGRLLEWNGWSC